MKALCVEVVDGRAELIFSGETPQAGRYYTLEDAVSGTSAQNKAFHALVQEYWRSGMHSYNAGSFEEFRELIKKHLGEGVDRWLYVDLLSATPKVVQVNHFEEIPQVIRDREDRRDFIVGRLKSWADYTKKQRTETIDRLIAEMEQAGVNTRKYQEILEGMSEH